MYRVIYRSTRISTDISWFQKDHKIKELNEKLKQEKKLIYENFVLTEDGLTGYYTSIWDDKESFNEWLNDPEVLEWRMTRLIFEAETGTTNDLISADLIL